MIINTVKELIAALEKYPEEVNVAISCADGIVQLELNDDDWKLVQGISFVCPCSE